MLQSIIEGLQLYIIKLNQKGENYKNEQYKFVYKIYSTFTTDLLGDVTIIGAGAGKIETVYSILTDI